MILMYHKVDHITPTPWWVTPAALVRHLQELQGRRFVYLDSYRHPDSEVVITFDDAYENLAHHAFAPLAERNIPFEIFVIGDAVGRWNTFDKCEPLTRHMGIEHLHEAVRCGGRLQWHSRSHPHLPDLDDASQVRELTVPETLARIFPAPHFNWFSYPGGAHDERCVALARQLFSGALSVCDGNAEDRWQLNRVEAHENTHLPP